MTQVISIFNNKGGVGKTTLVWNVADTLARKGKRVLMVDFDPQCNLSLAVLGDETFKGKLPTENVPYGTTVRAYLQRFLQNTGDFEFFAHTGMHTHKDAKLVAGDFWVNVYSESLSVGSDLLTGTGIAKYAVLRDMIYLANKKEIDNQSEPFDYAIIDLPPSFGSLVRAALYSSDYFIVPCTSDTFSSYCIGLIGNMLPTFFADWESGYKRFRDSNPQITKYDGLGKPKFAGWIFNGYDTLSGNYVQADKIHHDNIATSIQENIISNPNIVSATGLPQNSKVGEIEDMNVLVQNSTWQNTPVSQLEAYHPLQKLQRRVNWSKSQVAQISMLGHKFEEIADSIINICV
ncbi:MAG TPA: AAA family ATPase [Methanothrix soehngenii]|nr:AAA family ATPase [Methanothrix soehngenii]